MEFIYQPSIYSGHWPGKWQNWLSWISWNLNPLDFSNQLLIIRIGYIGCTIGLAQLCFCSCLSNTIQLWALWDGWSAPSDVILAYNEVECSCKGPRGLPGKTGRTHGEKIPLGIIRLYFEFQKNSQRSWRSAVKNLMQHSIFTWGTKV